MTDMTTIRQRTKDALADGTITGDGHTIFRPEFYAPHFTEDELRTAQLIQTLESDFSNPKSTIFDNDGNPVEKMDGVYNLNFLYWVAGINGVSNIRECFGRGSQAQAIVEAIQEALA